MRQRLCVTCIAVRIYIWHGYLLTGTGSNEYSQALARTLSRQGHDVTVFSQDPAAQSLDLAGAKVVRPRIGGRLPVFVLDSYPDLTAALLAEMPKHEVDAFVDANAAEIRAQGPADLLITNHLLLGGPVGAASGLPYVVKAHGSELEFAMRNHPGLCQWASETLAEASAVVAGSDHIKDVILELLDVPDDQIVVVPPGVDTATMKPRTRHQALAGLLEQAGLDQPNDGDERRPDGGNRDRLADFFEDPAATRAIPPFE